VVCSLVGAMSASQQSSPPAQCQTCQPVQAPDLQKICEAEGDKHKAQGEDDTDALMHWCTDGAPRLKREWRARGLRGRETRERASLCAVWNRNIDVSPMFKVSKSSHPSMP